MTAMASPLTAPLWADDIAIVRRATAHNFGETIIRAAERHGEDTEVLVLTMSSWPRADEACRALWGDEGCAAIEGGHDLVIRRDHDYREQPEPLPWFRCAHCGRTDNSDVT
jgi:hypothetical protein